MQSEATGKLCKFSGPTEYALKNLEQGGIYCQHYSAYNDPFEFWSYIHEGIPDPSKEANRYLAAAKAWGFPADTIKQLETNDVFAENVDSYFEECIDYQPDFNGLREQMRIACFATEQDSLLMWSHYGDGLRGFCLLFDENELVQNSREVFILTVRYAETPPVADAFLYGIAKDQVWFHEMAIEESSAKATHLGESNPFEQDYLTALDDAFVLSDAVLEIIFATKPLVWNYEQEKRLLVRANSNDAEPTFYKFQSAALKGVLIGERMPSAYRRRLEQIVSDHYGHAYVRTIRRSSTSYGLEVG